MIERDPTNARQDDGTVPALVRQARDLGPAERIALLRGLLPALMDDLGPSGFGELMAELKWEAARYDDGRPRPVSMDEL